MTEAIALVKSAAASVRTAKKLQEEEEQGALVSEEYPSNDE